MKITWYICGLYFVCGYYVGFRFSYKIAINVKSCFDFGYENDLVYNAKKLVNFVIGKLFKVAIRPEMFIGEGKIDWVEVCGYLGVHMQWKKCLY